MTKFWNVEIAVVNLSTRRTEWRKIGVNLIWSQVLDIRRKNKGFLTRYMRANNTNEPTCETCGAFGGHWLSCKKENATAVPV